MLYFFNQMLKILHYENEVSLLGIAQESLLQDRVFHYFHQLCQIPHGSRNEKALSDFILSWSKSLGLEALQDEVNNVFIRKPASSGYEDAPGIMLQAHLDMVCEKAVDSTHDFSTDPIQWVVDGDVLSTGGKTTLGADDGIGVAMAMAVLEDDTLTHPPLEVLFTVCEEDDFTGARHFDISQMRSTRLINLDNADNAQIICGSCGGMEVNWHMPVTYRPVPDGWNTWTLHISGLKGGHSGEDIHHGRGSANQLLGRALLAVQQNTACLVSSLTGGTFRLAIPRDAKADLSFDPTALEDVKAALVKLETDVQRELAITADQVSIHLEPTAPAPTGVATDPIVSAILLMPDGIFQMNEALTGLVDTSDNMGELHLTDKELHIVLEIRSARASLCTYLFQRMEQLAALLGGSCTSSNAYPSWDFRANSQLQKTAGQVYHDLFGKDPVFLTVHAGLEVGCFFEKKHDLDAIAIGPTCWAFHSPDERMSISGAKDMYRYLCQLLAALH